MIDYKFNHVYSIKEIFDATCAYCDTKLAFQYESSSGDRGMRTFSCHACKFVIKCDPQFKGPAGTRTEEFTGYKIYHIAAKGREWHYWSYSNKIMLTDRGEVLVMLETPQLSAKQIKNIDKLIMIQ